MQPTWLLLAVGLALGVALHAYWPQLLATVEQLKASLWGGGDGDVVAAARLLYRESIAGGMPKDAAKTACKTLLDSAVRLDDPLPPTTPATP